MILLAIWMTENLTQFQSQKHIRFLCATRWFYQRCLMVVWFWMLCEVLRSPTLRTELLLFDVRCLGVCPTWIVYQVVTKAALFKTGKRLLSCTQFQHFSVLFGQSAEARSVPLDTARGVLATLESMQATDYVKLPEAVMSCLFFLSKFMCLCRFCVLLWEQLCFTSVSFSGKWCTTGESRSSCPLWVGTGTPREMAEVATLQIADRIHLGDTVKCKFDKVPLSADTSIEWALPGN